VTFPPLWLLFKYADDTTLLVPENSDIDLATEFNHTKNWAVRNHLKINSNKTKEIVLANQELDIFIYLCYLMMLSVLIVLNYLVLPFQNNFKFDAHVNFVLR